MSWQETRSTIPMAFAAIAMLAVACGQTSLAAATASPSASVAASPSPSPSQSPSPSPMAPAYSGELTFSGGVSGNFPVRAPSGAASSDCGNGTVDAAVVIHGQEWDVSVSASPFTGPGQYTANSSLTVLISTPTYDLWTATSGTGVYASDRSVTLDIAITNMMAGPGEPGAGARIRGTMSCG